ncbi:hypothetical protein BSKO_03317 [Bryopsis sp. KO-2023]|nr:hypothetical protein BSKO_03317 [Bryopsis sp. KO-2023]
MLAGMLLRRLRCQPLPTGWSNARRMGSKPLKKQPLPENALLYKGPIHYVATAEQAEDWCRHLEKKVKVVGLGAEWRADMKRGQDHPVSMIQMCFRTEKLLRVVLFHVKYSGIPKKLRDVLTSETILKVGASLLYDKAKLKAHSALEMKNVFDLSWSESKVLRGGSMFRKPLNIKELVPRVMDKVMVREGKWLRSDWARRPLKREQMDFAALDAYAPFAVYERMKEIHLKRLARQEGDSDELGPIDTKELDFPWG